MGVFSHEGRLRTWLRLAIFAFAAFTSIAAVACFIGGILYLTGDLEKTQELEGNLAFTPLICYVQMGLTAGISLLLFVLSLVLRRFLDKDKHPLQSLGFNFKKGPLEFLYGIIIGVVLLGVGYLAQVAFGTTTPVFDGGWSSAPLLTVGVIVMFVFSATFEEFLLRGYPTKILDEATHRAVAVCMPAVIFGVMHLANPGTTWLSTLNITLAGVLLGLVYLKSNSIWLASGLHFGWNFAQGPILGLGVSGLNGFPTLLTAIPNSGDLWSGGEFGLEGSLIATIVIVVFIIGLILLKRVPFIDFMKQNSYDTV